MNNKDDFISAEETAELLGVTVETLEEWRKKGIGPRAFQLPKASIIGRSDSEGILVAMKNGVQVSVAHEILEADPMDWIEFLDGNPANLNRSNLKNLGPDPEGTVPIVVQ